MSSSEAAVQARTSVDMAAVGSLTTYARHPSGQHTVTVPVSARPDGTVEVEVPIDSLPLRQLLARPVATLQVRPAGCEPVLLHGAARRVAGGRGPGTLVFGLDVAAARVGSPAVLLDRAHYDAAEPDPLRHVAPAALEHLNDGHADALAACLRAGGHDASYAVATRLDAAGLTVVALREDGASTVRLRFPQPVRSLVELPASLGCALSSHCGCSAQRRRVQDPLD